MATCYSVFIALWLRTRVLCPLITDAAFAGICRLTPLDTFGENLSDPRCADKASQCRALTAHGGFPDQAAL
jgi:hypothetical protein